MRNSAKRRSRTPQKKSSVTPQNLIILLLVVLIVLVAANLYLDHLAPNHKSTQTQKSGQELRNETPTSGKTAAANPRSATNDSLKTISATALVPPLVKPAIIPSLTADMPAPRDVHVQLLNGCGVPGLASRARAALRSRGFDVLTFGNAQAQDYNRTVVIARSDAPQSELAARRLANALGVTVDQISVQADPQLVDTDVTIILGADYQKLNLTAE